MKVYAILGMFLSILVLSCNSRTELKSPTTAIELINASIQYHDPGNHWHQLKTKVTFNTRFIDKSYGEDSQANISFDNEKSTFSSLSKKAGIEMLGFVSPDTCYKKAVQEVPDSLVEKIKESSDCASVVFFRDYYQYMLGMPMKLRDSSAIVRDSILTREFGGKTYDIVQVQYEPLDKNPVWYFYFDQDSHAFELCKFTSREDETEGGEYIVYKNEKTIEGIKLYSQQTWLYNRPSLDSLALDELIFEDYSLLE